MTHRRPDLFDKLVIAADRQIRRRMKVWEFSDDPACILRLGRIVARADARLEDGTTVHRGDPIGIIHLSNERLPRIPANGPDLAWARLFHRMLSRSFRLLAEYAAKAPDLADVHVFGGLLPLVYTPATIRLLQHLGFEVHDPVPPRTLTERVVDWGARLWTWLLRRAFNPASAQGLRLSDLQRRQVWISRQALVALHTSNRQEADHASVV